MRSSRWCATSRSRSRSCAPWPRGSRSCGSGRFDVILLDLNLPDSLGLTTFLRLQPKAGLQPIIVLVGQADEDLGVEAVERGALDYLIKQQIVSTLLAKALRYATERTHTLLALKASETPLSRVVRERRGGRVPDDAGRQVHGREPGAGPPARLRRPRTSCWS